MAIYIKQNLRSNGHIRFFLKLMSNKFIYMAKRYEAVASTIFFIAGPAICSCDQNTTITSSVK